MYRPCRRTQRRESMLLIGSLPLAQGDGNGQKVLLSFLFALFGRVPGKEAIADAAHRLQKDRFRGIVFYITAQADHEVVDGPRVSILVYPPDLLQQLLAGDDAPLVEDEIAQQVSLHQGKADSLIRGGELKRSKVDGAFGEGESG